MRRAKGAKRKTDPTLSRSDGNNLSTKGFRRIDAVVKIGSTADG